MAAGATRVLERLFVVYCLAHLALLFLIDLPLVLPGVYPPALCRWYTTTFKDPLTGDPEPWFRSFLYIGIIPKLVFCPIAAYAFWKGSCKWIRTPVIIYATHLITAVAACIAQILFADFSKAKVPSPQTLGERLTLSAFFAILLVVPLLMLLLVLFSPAYNQVEKQKKK